MITAPAVPHLKQLVILANDIYTRADGWTHYYDAGTDHGVCFAVQDNGLYLDIIFRGSKTTQDWFRDFKARPVEHPVLGGVEEGFFEGLPDAVAELAAILRGAKLAGQKVRITGHSLGAARALLFAALLMAGGFVPDFVAAFAPPKPGFHKLAVVLSPIQDLYCFRNGIDPVPLVPPALPDAPYEQPRSLDLVRCAPAGMFPDLFAWHSCALYQKAIEALPMAEPPKLADDSGIIQFA